MMITARTYPIAMDITECVWHGIQVGISDHGMHNEWAHLQLCKQHSYIQARGDEQYQLSEQLEGSRAHEPGLVTVCFNV